MEQILQRLRAFGEFEVVESVNVEFLDVLVILIDLDLDCS